MRLTRLCVRFYKSFNYDYERKAARGADRDPSDVLDDGAFYPYVRVDIEPSITTIVSANESGKRMSLALAALRGVRPGLMLWMSRGHEREWNLDAAGAHLVA
jgi:hypothetical protein